MLNSGTDAVILGSDRFPGSSLGQVPGFSLLIVGSSSMKSLLHCILGSAMTLLRTEDGDLVFE